MLGGKRQTHGGDRRQLGKHVILLSLLFPGHAPLAAPPASLLKLIDMLRTEFVKTPKVIERRVKSQAEFLPHVTHDAVERLGIATGELELNFKHHLITKIMP